MRHEAVIDGTLVSWLRARRRAGAVRARRAGLGRAVDAVPRAHGRDRGRPARLRPVGQERRLAVLARGLRGLPARLPRPPRPRPRAAWWRTTGAAVALTLGPRIERLVAIDTLPLLPGHRWPWIARAWRTPVVGELAMGFTGRTLLRRVGGLSAEHADQILRHFDHGTQRAILKLYRSARENVAALDAVDGAGAGAVGRARPLSGTRVGGPDRGRAGRRDEGRDRCPGRAIGRGLTGQKSWKSCRIHVQLSVS